MLICFDGEKKMSKVFEKYKAKEYGKLFGGF